MSHSEFLTVKELSGYINVKAKTIYAWIGRRAIPFYKMEGIFRFKRTEIDQWLTKHSTREKPCNTAFLDN